MVEFTYCLHNGFSIGGDKESESGRGHVMTQEYLCSVHLPCHLQASTVLIYVEQCQRT
jgi:hypothetical protein